MVEYLVIFPNKFLFGPFDIAPKYNAHKVCITLWYDIEVTLFKGIIVGDLPDKLSDESLNKLLNDLSSKLTRQVTCQVT